MNEKLKEFNVESLFKAILKLENIDECYKFFEDLCTCLLYTSLLASGSVCLAGRKTADENTG